MVAIGGSFRTRGEAKSSQLELARLMRIQSGVVALRQLQALGVTKAERAGMLGRHELWRLHRSVYADTRSPMTPKTVLRTAPRCACW